jgi:UDP-2-acetamido-3-amino-2,3-dideoxy-glucuronate N-acetyltransferase
MGDKNTLLAFNDYRGSLIPLEFSEIPFIPKRIFVVNNVPTNTIRGNHSHYTTKQLIICTNGSVDVILYDGINEITTNLQKGDTILVPELIWDSQKFLTDNSEIIVLCSTSYDYDDYIFDFNKYLSIIKII